MGAQKRLNGTYKVNRQTDTNTDGQTDGHFDLKRADAFKKKKEKLDPPINFFSLHGMVIISALVGV